MATPQSYDIMWFIYFKIDKVILYRAGSDYLKEHKISKNILASFE